MRVGYGKIGRVTEIDPAKWGESGGDNEPPALLLTLAKRHPDVTWVCVGRNSGWEPPLPNIENPWQTWGSEVKTGMKNASVEDVVKRLDAVTMPTFTELDGIILWLGQHGTSNSPIPKVEDRSVVTSPQISFIHYTSFILRGINVWRRENPLDREEVWLLPDARNYIKGRDLKWPRRHPILCQFDWSRREWVERYGDPKLPEEYGFSSSITVSDGRWRATDWYNGSGLELVGIPDWSEMHPKWKDWEERENFGILINEARNYGMRPELTRLDAMQRYVLPLDPSWVYGRWTDKSLTAMDRIIKPIAYDKFWPLMLGTKSTFTTPSSGSGWATAKPWECFVSGTICFFHPAYDTQGHIIPTLQYAKDDELRHLTRWLRITSPEDLAKKVTAVSQSRETYEWLRDAQLRHVQWAQRNERCVNIIDRRLGL